MEFLLHGSVYFTIFGIKIYMYGVMIVLGILAGIGLAFWSFKKKGINTENIVNIGLISIPCAVLGARLYYCIFFDREYDIASFFNLSNGGLAVYGAVIGGALGVIVYCLIKKLNFFQVADCVVPSLAIGQCLGRIGCYFGGCCYGIETDFHVFPFSVEIDGVWHLATFFYESFATLIICAILINVLRFVNAKGVSFALYFILYGIARFFIEGVRGDSLYFLGMRVSQLLSAILFVAGIVALIIFIMRFKKQNGTLNNFFSCSKQVVKESEKVTNVVENVTIEKTEENKENLNNENK